MISRIAGAVMGGIGSLLGSKGEEMIKKSLGKSRNEKLNNLLNPNKTFGQ